jgi:hypothetical protein
MGFSELLQSSTAEVHPGVADNISRLGWSNIRRRPLL